MAIHAIGKVTVTSAGTPVQIYTGSPLERARFLLICVNPANTGTVYIGAKGLNKSTLAGVMAILPKTAQPLSIFVDSCAINPEDLWVDADTSNDNIVAGLAD